MKKANQIMWGILLIGVGLVMGLNAFGLTRIELFFDGWWTLFIIVPCLGGLLSGQDKTGSFIGLCIGVFLLLCCQGFLNFDALWKLFFPAVIIAFGVKMILGSLMDRENSEAVKRFKENGEHVYGTAVFTGETLDFTGEVFRGAELNAVFGGLKCDLRNAVVEGDCIIQASAVFGGIDIFVPDNINVKISSNSMFGGVSNKTARCLYENAPTLYIKGCCLFGGVDVK